MLIPPRYTITHQIVSLLTKIEANRTAFQSTAVPEKIISNLTHVSLLKSSVYSAKIEGNSLTPDDIENQAATDEKQYERQEVENIISALSYMRDKNIPKMIDIPYLTQLHNLVMHKLVHPSLAGKIRKEPSAIFDGTGNVVYMTPPPSEINDLLLALLQMINNQTDMFPLIKAPLAHLVFEKIHPFLDGNGRVGRLLFQAILAKNAYHFNWLLSIEELLADKKQTYYTLLDQEDATEFIVFILELLYAESERLKGQLTVLANPQKEDFLLPRRREIFEIIKDHTMVSFEQIQRRFLKIPARTLRYDIKQLEKEGFIRKIGSTRGALYQVKK
ncbi:MAG TPA: Fic family protein [Methylomirabilota bacterium]|nr:Fic family protein [Methylomirabilota bacterium]